MNPQLLSDEECRELLAVGTLGRVGLTSGALPLIMPVEYVYADGAIVFRTEHDALSAAARGNVLAFEVDSFDANRGEGWTVHVLGRATTHSETNGVGALPSFDGDVRAPRAHYVRLHCEIVSGRRLVSSRG